MHPDDNPSFKPVGPGQLKARLTAAVEAKVTDPGTKDTLLRLIADAEFDAVFAIFDDLGIVTES